MNKKYILSFGIISMTIAPAAVVVSCSFPDDNTNAITTEMNNVQESMIDSLKVNSTIENGKYFFSSSKDDDTMQSALAAAQGDKLSIVGTNTIDTVLGIDSKLSDIDLKGTSITWTYIRTESPVGATYTIAITIAKSTVKPKFVELWVRSSDFNLVNEDVKAIEEVKYKLTDKIKGTYRSLLNPSDMDELIGEDAMTVEEFAAKIDETNDGGAQPDAVDFYTPVAADLIASNNKTTTLKFEIRSTGAIIIDTDGNAERKAYTVYGIITSGSRNDEFAFTLNSALYSDIDKMSAEEERFRSQLGNIAEANEEPIYTLGSLNISNRNVLPSTFVLEDSNATKEIIGFDDSRRIHGTEYSFSFPNEKTHSDDYGTVDVIVTLSIPGSSITPRDTKVTFKNFQTKLGADTAITHAINTLSTSMYEVQRHNNKVIKGKAVSITDTKLEKLPSEILKEKDEAGQPVWGSSNIKNIIPVAFTGFTHDLLTIEFIKNEINTDDLRGELGVEVKISYKGSAEIYDSFILLLTGFRTIQDVAMNTIDTSPVKVGTIDTEIIIPVDGQIVESPTGSGTIIDAHKSLYKLLKNTLKTTDGNFITTIDFGDYSQYYTGFQILASSGWGTKGATKKIKVKILLRREGYEFSATTEEINLIP